MGGSASKRKGNGYERELVKQAEASGLEAKRAWGSDGRSMGMHEEVDCLINGQKVQAKRRKSIAKFLKPTEHVDVVVFREDGGTSLVLIDWFDWLDQQKEMANMKQQIDVLGKAIIEQASEGAT
tara:strand:- start:611 stop:982 length:372 start_codon:yes stop_codon:yes gene_type:complete